MSTDSNHLQLQQSYTDLNQLNNLRQLGKEDKTLALHQVAQQFESLFVNMMLKNMRAVNEVFAKDNPLNSSEMKFYRDMFDQQLSLSLSQGKGMGLADAFFRQMKNSYLGDNYVAGEKIDIDEFDRNKYVNSNPYSEPVASIIKRKEDISLLEKIDTPEQFITTLLPYAEKISEKLGVDATVLLAQSALETGWGKFAIRDSQGQHTFNMFNIKAGKRWDGHFVNVPTIEFRDGIPQQETASFRRYNNLEESFEDFYNFIQQPRYQSALEVASNNAEFLQALQSAGYATDPQYASKIQEILHDIEGRLL